MSGVLHARVFQGVQAPVGPAPLGYGFLVLVGSGVASLGEPGGELADFSFLVCCRWQNTPSASTNRVLDCRSPMISPFRRRRDACSASWMSGSAQVSMASLTADGDRARPENRDTYSAAGQ